MTTNTTVATENVKDCLSGINPLKTKIKKEHGTPPEAEKQQQQQRQKPSVLSPLNKVLTPKSKNQKSSKKMRLSISKDGRENNSAILNVIQMKAASQKGRRSIGTKKEVNEGKINIKIEKGESKRKRSKSNGHVVIDYIC